MILGGCDDFFLFFFFHFLFYSDGIGSAGGELVYGRNKEIGSLPLRKRRFVMV